MYCLLAPSDTKHSTKNANQCLHVNSGVPYWDFVPSHGVHMNVGFLKPPNKTIDLTNEKGDTD